MSLCSEELLKDDPAGGARSSATENARTRGSASLPCETAADAQEHFPPVRRHPSRNSVMTYHDNRSIMLYVTVVTEKRSPILANKAVFDCILAAWKAATDWLVGWYVIMPDHIHFFCAPATYPPPNFHRWMAYWKSLATKAYWRTGEDRVPARPKRGGRAGARPSRVEPSGRAGARPSRVERQRTRRSASRP